MRSDEALEKLGAQAAQVISRDELQAKLASGKKLRVKLGVDPSTTDLHLGHSIVLRKLRQFQDLGHQAVLIIGDFTGMIGDPSGRSATRPNLTRAEVAANARTYFDQAFKILDPSKTETRYNSEWFERMNFQDVIHLTSQVTLQQLLHRDDFKNRMRKEQPIRGHEILYPVMQGWDSVMVKADVELGGTDQLFNILMGRALQKEQGHAQQVVFLLPILEGLDGSKKMSKSLGNYVGITEPPSEMFGKLMSISDKLMGAYYNLLLNKSIPKIAPVEAKKQLAFEIVQTYHSTEAAKKTFDDWNARFSEKRLSDAELPNFCPTDHLDFVDLIGQAFQNGFGINKSRTQIRRLIEQGSVQLDGNKITDPNAAIKLRGRQVLRLDKTHAVRVDQK
ncbi:MAG TPA: tyrosine--tRNA ligase [Candidatus Udaeobacter sp.]|nr:tyrosine--tRNA ligase [Candidatus Udaeobacter sp.]